MVSCGASAMPRSCQPAAGAVAARRSLRSCLTTIDSPTAGCCWSTPIPTTRRSARAPRWPSTPPTARTSRWSPAPLGEMGEVLVADLEHLAFEPGRRPRSAPDPRAGRGHEGPGRHRPPLPRRRGALPRLRHGVGRARRRDHRARRPRRTRSGSPTSPRRPTCWSRSSARCGRRCWSPTTSTAATATPTTCRPTGSRPTAWRWPPPRRTSPTWASAWDVAEGLLGRDAREPAARLAARAARLGRHQDVRGHGPRGPDAAVRGRRRVHHRTHRRPRPHRAEDGRAEGARHPDRPSRGRSSPWSTARATATGASSTTGWSRAPPARVDEATGLEDDLFAGAVVTALAHRPARRPSGALLGAVGRRPGAADPPRRGGAARSARAGRAGAGGGRVGAAEPGAAQPSPAVPRSRATARGWCLVVLAAINGRSEGDYLVAGDWLGWTFLALCTLGGRHRDRTRHAARQAPPGAREDPDDLLTRRP